MNERRNFYRKVAYIVAIVVLLVPLSMLSMPASGGGDQQASAGGKLAQLRTENKLSQANLGEIDPASETMKLATLGLRGVASNLLWEKANEYKKKEDWTNLSATLNQITKLQPNFTSVWEFQAWNLSYNVSAEFDDYRDRYFWVVEGIKFLKRGERYNEDDPKLLWTLGWNIAQKIGRADEYIQYRRLFKEDDDFHPADRPRDRRDNWLVGREWFQKGEEAVNHKGKQLRGKSPLIFSSQAPMTLMNYAEALEEDGIFGEKARLSWKRAAEAWHEYGARPIPASATFAGLRIQLNNEERLREEAAELEAELQAFAPEMREKMVQERRDALSDEERDALETPENERSADQYQLASAASRKVDVSVIELAEEISKRDPERADKAERLARRINDKLHMAGITSRYRDIVNFVYWQTRAEYEQTPEALLAREQIHQGGRKLKEGDLLGAQDLFERGMKQWRIVFDNYPLIRDEGVSGEELVDSIVQYRDLLNELDEPFPADFPLWDIIEMHDRESRLKDLKRPTEEPSEKPDDESEEEADETDKPEDAGESKSEPDEGNKEAADERDKNEDDPSPVNDSETAEDSKTSPDESEDSSDSEPTETDDAKAADSDDMD